VRRADGIELTEVDLARRGEGTIMGAVTCSSPDAVDVTLARVGPMG